MKRSILIVFATILVLCGCTERESTDVYTERCSVCGDDVDRFIRTVYDDYVCASCFWKEDWQMCNGCGLAYDLNEFDCADGYCSGCSELETWPCSVCEERFALAHMLDVGDGYYLCAQCSGQFLFEANPQIGDEIKENSPLISRYEQFEPVPSEEQTDSTFTDQYKQSVTVYITDNGMKYHKQGCQYLWDSSSALSMADAEAQGYTPCSECW